MNLFQAQRRDDCSVCITHQITEMQMHNAPAAGIQVHIAAGVFSNAEIAEVLPTVAFQCYSECREQEVNAEPADLVLKQVGNASSDQNVLCQRFQVGSSSSPSFLSKVARLVPVLIAPHDGAALATEPSAHLDTIVRNRERVLTVSAGESRASRCQVAGLPTVNPQGGLAGNDRERSGALCTDFCHAGRQGGELAVFTTVLRPADVTDSHLECFSTLRARLLNMVLNAGSRTVGASSGGIRQVVATTTLAVDSWSRWVVARPRAVLSGGVFERNAVERLAASLTRQQWSARAAAEGLGRGTLIGHRSSSLRCHGAGRLQRRRSLIIPRIPRQLGPRVVAAFRARVR